MRKVYIDVHSGNKRMAISENDIFTDLWLEQSDQMPKVDDIYIGRVTKRLLGLKAVFVDIGKTKPGFLHESDFFPYQKHVKDIQPGDCLIVRVIKEVIGTKGPKLSGNIALTGTLTVYLPFGGYVAVSNKIKQQLKDNLRERLGQLCKEGEGVIVRTEAAQMPFDSVEDEFITLRKTWQHVQSQQLQAVPDLLFRPKGMIDRLVSDYHLSVQDTILTNDRAIARDINQTLDSPQSVQVNPLAQVSKTIDRAIVEALKLQIMLPGGASLTIDETEALTVIDVNSGGYTAASHQVNAAVQTNLHAAEEIARQLRLKSIGGIVIIDFIQMDKTRDKTRVQTVLEDALKRDRLKTVVYGYTALGLMELTRKKTRHSMMKQLGTDWGKHLKGD